MYAGKEYYVLNDCTAIVAIQVCFFCVGSYIPGCITLNWSGLILVHKRCIAAGCLWWRFLGNKTLVVSLICNFLHWDRSNKCMELYMVLFFSVCVIVWLHESPKRFEMSLICCLTTLLWVELGCLHSVNHSHASVFGMWCRGHWGTADQLRVTWWLHQ